jgi:peptidoglycan-N-acetylglucosamine deacetylase
MIWGEPITQVDTNSPLAALTFDDGPDPIYTPAILNILEKYDAKATFFMVGEKAAKYPDLVAGVARAGHVLGNHSWTHPHLPSMVSRLRRIKQLWKGARSIAPYGRKLFRPPFGAFHRSIQWEAALFGYRIILWNASAQDWISQSSKEIEQKMKERIKPGTIFLLHDGSYDNRVSDDTLREAMIGGLENALSALAGRLRFVTIPDLLRSGRAVCQWPHLSDT